MADNPITTPLPADLPTNWAYGQTVAPTGAEVGLTRQHGYNYLMEQVNAAQSAANLLGAAFEGLVEVDANGKIPIAQIPDLYPTQTKGTFTPELWAGTVKLRQRVQWGYYVKIGALCYFSLHVAAWHDGVSGNLILKGFPYPFVVCEISVATRLLTSNRTLWNVLFIAGNTDTSVSTQGAFYNAETGTPISTSQLTDQAISFLQGVYRCE